MTKNKLWSGRFSAATDSAVAAFTASVQFDSRMAAHDIAGSIAHARMLGKTGILDATDVTAIIDGLEQIGSDIAAGSFDWKPELEDVHMNIEAELTDRIGDAGKRLHTGRSRNDQVATDMRLWTRDAIDAVVDITRVLQQALIDQAQSHADTVMPGFTHMQAAQPVTLGHHLLAWNEMLERDVGRLLDGRKRLNRSPLGSAALAGTSFAIDRHMTAAELGFDSITVNSLDAVSDRDFTIEFASAAALQMVHLSRMCEEIILWASDAFGFIDISDAFCTGSSIMPQKKNPDVAEIIRGKTARVNGNLHALLMLMKSQPLAYNRDNQEDKEPVFDTVDTLVICLDLMGRMVPNISFRKDVMREAAARGFSTATDLADYLVRKGVPFRDAHEIVGKTVRYAQDNDVMLDQIELATLKSFSDKIDSDVFNVLTLDGSVSARNHPGGTAPEQVKAAAAAARQRLAESAAV